MNDMNKILDTRLAEIGCEKLPPAVKSRLASDLESDVEAYAKKRAGKVNASHVGRAFRAAFLIKKTAVPAAT